ncbi:hypothetical protein MPTK1_4g18070 [Marchantia polymorpha subsp. ruderalis]|uniref:Uncharacterized protein n=2 Tax=Marchantia polymorpha TaxID=3197 RepID=A0AAF6BB47_MARPO|nr:hypothetical protein MARPO_0041s0088 [Marchantia polymorpha]BBN09231.1 hypothetical protein Mp_4g18070 [Marchantia polymorpha subsp. ruderalis]|eukprot:PTQ40219.1 hypothetical protein MARPO_0041s0088 [Marchantia polymorpha]
MSSSRAMDKRCARGSNLWHRTLCGPQANSDKRSLLLPPAGRERYSGPHVTAPRRRRTTTTTTSRLLSAQKEAFGDQCHRIGRTIVELAALGRPNKDLLRIRTQSRAHSMKWRQLGPTLSRSSLENLLHAATSDQMGTQSRPPVP